MAQQEGHRGYKGNTGRPVNRDQSEEMNQILTNNPSGNTALNSRNVNTHANTPYSRNQSHSFHNHCWNCGVFGHSARQCAQPKNPTEINRKRIEFENLRHRQSNQPNTTTTTNRTTVPMGSLQPAIIESTGDNANAVAIVETLNQSLFHSLHSGDEQSSRSVLIGNKTINLSDVPVIMIMVNGVMVRALPDTGACVSAISEEFAKHLDLKIEPWTQERIEAIDGRTVTPVGYVSPIRIVLGQAATNAVAIVIKKTTPHFTIGWDLIRSLNFVIGGRAVIIESASDLTTPSVVQKFQTIKQTPHQLELARPEETQSFRSMIRQRQFFVAEQKAVKPKRKRMTTIPETYNSSDEDARKHIKAKSMFFGILPDPISDIQPTESSEIQLAVIHNEVILPMSSKYISLKALTSIGVESHQIYANPVYIEKGIVVREGIVNITDGVVSALVSNQRLVPIELHKDSQIAYLQDTNIITEESDISDNQNIRIMSMTPITVDREEYRKHFKLGSHLTSVQCEYLIDLFIKYRDVFALEEDDLGLVKGVEHHIDTGNAAPVRRIAYRLFQWEREETEQQVEDMLRRRIIFRSSFWSKCQHKHRTKYSHIIDLIYNSIRYLFHQLFQWKNFWRFKDTSIEVRKSSQLLVEIPAFTPNTDISGDTVTTEVVSELEETSLQKLSRKIRSRVIRSPRRLGDWTQ